MSGPLVAPDLVPVLAAVVNPKLIYRFIINVLFPVQFPMLRASITNQLDGRLRLTLEVPPGYRESIASCYGAVGIMRTIPTVLGLSPARVEIMEISGRRLV